MDKKTSYAEFSSQLKEKNVVIMEFGRHYTRCGFAGEPAPRAIIKTCHNDPECQNKSTNYLHDISNADELETKLGNFIERIYFNHLAVSPKEKKVIVVESVFCKSLFRNTLVKIFFDRFNVPSLLFVPDHLMALATLGRSTGIVVDIGAIEAISIAVVDGVTLLDGAQFASLGAKMLDTMILNELVRSNPKLKGLDPEVVEDIRVKTCFVAPFERGLKMTSDKLIKSKNMQTEAIRLAEEENQEISIGTLEGCYFLAEPDGNEPPSVDYHLGCLDVVKIPGNLREGACELYFEIIGHEHSLTTMIVETILMAPIDCRRALAENILVIGGMSNLPGLEHRLHEELKHIDKYERFRRKIPSNFKFHKPLCPRNYVSWLGASMFCTPSSIELRATNRDQWLSNGKKNPRDWSDLLH
jgi:actin-related protein 10